MICWWKIKERRGERTDGGIFVEELRFELLLWRKWLV